ncbi:hypothetical protein CLG85_021615 [Yangia mangrovi]|uniref:Uncharacterized protein n=1 Tax=Alloyangia mangrovi TaxID=1779329 RepID=A0A2A3JXF8_9RHOB|nr:hypothetical protein [Alloyangia mangrovi]MCT4372762.1 hypothetical protein [Alloyangia mangrovi]
MPGALQNTLPEFTAPVADLLFVACDVTWIGRGVFDFRDRALCAARCRASSGVSLPPARRATLPADLHDISRQLPATAPHPAPIAACAAARLPLDAGAAE